MRVLVVDDSKAMRRILTRFLAPLGFHVSEAGNGREALELMGSSDGFDLVLVDWNMPVMDGIEFITALRSESSHDRTRLLVVTSQTEIEQIREALEAGADEFLMKPFTRESLLSKLEILKLQAS